MMGLTQLAIALGQFLYGFVRSAWGVHYWFREDLEMSAKSNTDIDLSEYGPYRKISWLTYQRIRFKRASWPPRIPVQGDLFEPEIYLRGTNYQIGYWQKEEGIGMITEWTNPVFKALFWLGFGMDFKDTRV